MNKENILNLIASEQEDNAFILEEQARITADIISKSEALWLSEFNDDDAII